MGSLCTARVRPSSGTRAVQVPINWLMGLARLGSEWGNINS